MEALVTQFPLDVERFEEALEQLWPRWDHDQDGAAPRLHAVRPRPALPGQHGPLAGCSWPGASSAVTWPRAGGARLGALLSPVRTWRRLHRAAPCRPTGAISRAEFFRPEVGLLDFVRTNLLRQRVALVPVPDISQERLRWFEHFDEEKTGSLKQEELVRAAPRQDVPCMHVHAMLIHTRPCTRPACAQVRALIKTYSLASDLGQVRQMRELVSAVWPLFDLDGTGRVSQQEFLRPGDGLADAIIASRAS